MQKLSDLQWLKVQVIMRLHSYISGSQVVLTLLFDTGYVAGIIGTTLWTWWVKLYIHKHKCYAGWQMRGSPVLILPWPAVYREYPQEVKEDYMSHALFLYFLIYFYCKCMFSKHDKCHVGYGKAQRQRQEHLKLIHD